MLRVEGLKSSYGRIEVLHGIDLEVRAGELVALVGRNGAGKTTLLRALSGVQPVQAGRILLDGAPIERVPAHRRVGLGLAQVPEGRQVFGPLPVQDNLRLGAWRRTDDGIAADLARTYALFPILKERRGQPAAGLSGGQQQMLAIGRALMAKPRLLLLDEPSMGLAPIIADRILDVVARLRTEGVTILLVEQNATAALAIADRAYVLETGRIVLAGTGAELLHDPRIREAYLGL
jgi:branched-chain amino acid transport system ATP-binding protein